MLRPTHEQEQEECLCQVKPTIPTLFARHAITGSQTKVPVSQFPHNTNKYTLEIYWAGGVGKVMRYVSQRERDVYVM